MVRETRMRININDMDYELNKLKAQLSVLKDVMEEYSGRTIDNIVANIEARIKVKEAYNG